MLPAEEVLKQYWGFERFRPLQKEIIDTLLDNQDCMVLMPTGGGKSLCYQVPALCIDGMALIVAPLVSLMHDQVTRLREKNIPAAYIHSGMHYREVTQVLRNAVDGHLKLLYISPERIQNKVFSQYIRNCELNLIAVDEAHCISQWGHDFRPEYLQISTLREIFPEVPILALTASATKEVTSDIKSYLQLNRPRTFAQSFERKNIFYNVLYSEGKLEAVAAYIAKVNGSCIIYCRSRKKTEELAALLRQQGVDAVAYHAGLNRQARGQAQAAWMDDTCPVIVATSAFGMGIDKGTVRTVIHFDVPEHLEAYYQETGRAGRDGQPSQALLLYNNADINRLRASISEQFPPEQFIRAVYQAVCDYLQIPIGSEPDTYFHFDFNDFLQKFKLPFVPAYNAMKLLGQQGLWMMSESLFVPATIMFKVGRSVLDEINSRYPQLAYVSTGILRLFTGVLNNKVPIRISMLARHLKIDQKEIEIVLSTLQQMGVVAYEQSKEGPQLFFNHYRVDSRQLHIDTKHIRFLKERHEARTDSIIAYVTNREKCRNRILLEYFDEAVLTDCGHCDVCTAKSAVAAGPDLEQQLLNILKPEDETTLKQLAVMLSSPVSEVAAIVRKLVDKGLLLLKDNELIVPAHTPGN